MPPWFIKKGDSIYAVPTGLGNQINSKYLKKIFIALLFTEFKIQ